MANSTLMTKLPGAEELFLRSRDSVSTFDLPQDLRGYSVLDPGVVLDSGTQDEIYSVLVPVTTSSFGADMTPYWAQRRQQGYFNRLAEFIFVADAQDQIVGWTGYSVLKFDGYQNIYIDSSGMIPAKQSQGIMRALWAKRLVNSAFVHNKSPRLLVSARSESPILYKLFCGLVGRDRVYPNVGGALPDHIIRCAADLAAWLDQSALLERERLIVRGAYANLDALYDELPSTGDFALDRLFREELGPLDAYLLIGEVSAPERLCERGCATGVPMTCGTVEPSDRSLRACPVCIDAIVRGN
ncbi:GNAT family N-acetyltransferase [Bradyrhizobium sp. USDA 10063]